jgi:sterol desaturase/sphingolipid hydroxylase (fatty acid hydroxylase superfamily)
MSGTWLRLLGAVGRVAAGVRDDLVDAALSSRSAIGWIGALRFVGLGAIVLWLKWGFDYVDEKPKVLPAKVFLTRSTWQDLGIIVANSTLTGALALAAVPDAACTRIAAALQSLFEPATRLFVSMHSPVSTLGKVVAVAVIIVSMDFGAYAQHALMHRSRYLWEFHKVHHSALVLSPLTSLRAHVVEMLFRAFVLAAVVGIASGGLRHFLPEQDVLAAVAGGGAIYGATYAYLLFLNHSHIWWSWGPLEYVLNSPAMHVIHHSRDSAHFNKNMGNLLAVWDVIFRTHHKTTRALQPIQLGLDDGFDWTSASQAVLFVRPFVRVGSLLRPATYRSGERPGATPS